jgi:hypothetical protein
VGWERLTDQWLYKTSQYDGMRGQVPCHPLPSP